MCAGVTTYNALRNSGARGAIWSRCWASAAGAPWRAVRGKMGFRTVAIARGEDKEPLARSSGRAITSNSQTRMPPRN